MLTIYFEDTRNIGTMVLVPGSSTRIPIEIAAGTSANHEENDSSRVSILTGVPQTNYMVCNMLAYDINYITIKIEPEEGMEEKFSLREIMLFEEIHVGRNADYPYDLEMTNSYTGTRRKLFKTFEQGDISPINIQMGTAYTSPPSLILTWESDKAIECVFVLLFEDTGASSNSITLENGSDTCVHTSSTGV